MQMCYSFCKRIVTTLLASHILPVAGTGPDIRVRDIIPNHFLMTTMAQESKVRVPD